MPALGSSFSKNVFDRAARGLRKSGSGFPVVVGETGVPMDIGDSLSKGDFSLQIQALERVLSSLEKEFLSWTLWTYTVDNSNEHGDLWNGENLSLWSKDQVSDQSDLNSGSRALEAAVRPYAMRIAGQPLETFFEAGTSRKRFFLKVRLSLRDHAQTLTTILFVPKIQYVNGIRDAIGGGEGNWSFTEVDDSNMQGYLWEHRIPAKDESKASIDQWVQFDSM